MKHEPSGGEQGWQERPKLVASIRFAAVVVPIAVSIAIGLALTWALPEPSSTPWGIVRWSAVAIASVGALLLAERVARRVIPLSTLFKLSLAFPDEVPSRLGLALRIGTTAQLRKRIEEVRVSPDGEPPGEAARRLLELVGLLSRHDRLTRGHSERVRGYAHLVGVEMGFTGRELDRLRWAALLHDIGKIDVPSGILNKPGRLTDEEFEIIKQHPLSGKAYVQPLAPWLGSSVNAVWEHHERFDGNGYPHRLSGTGISLAARIVSVVDAYDVMTSARSYKVPMSGAAARAELSKHAGSQFDPGVVRAFLNVSTGVLNTASRRSRWLSQAVLFPQAVIAQVGTSLGTAFVTAAAIGTTLGVAGVVANASAEPSELLLGSGVLAPSTRIGLDQTTGAAGRTASTIGDRPDGSESSATTADTERRSITTTTSIPGPTPTTTGSGVGVPSNGSNTVTTTPVTATTVAGPSDSPTSGPTPGTTTPPATAGPLTPPPSTTQPPTATPTATTLPTATMPTLPSTTLPTLPSTTLPTLPSTTLPTTTLPTLPSTTLPPVTIPVVTIPVVTLPPVTIPVVTLPPVTIPVVIPLVTLPTTLPSVTIPMVTIPMVTVPVGTVPVVTVPNITLPGLGL